MWHENRDRIIPLLTTPPQELRNNGVECTLKMCTLKVINEEGKVQIPMAPLSLLGCLHFLPAYEMGTDKQL